MPKIHEELLEEYSEQGLPPDDILRNYLLWEREGARFNEDVVDAFIERLRATLGFAGLDNWSKKEATKEEDTPKNGTDPKTHSEDDVQVGSFVQWTSQGVDQFQIPQQVAGIDGDWVFVEGNQTGIPMSELSVVDPPESSAPLATPPANPFFKPPSVDETLKNGIALDRTTLDEGAVRLEWPDELSEDSVEEFQDWMIGRINRARRKAGLEKIKIEETK